MERSRLLLLLALTILPAPGCQTLRSQAPSQPVAETGATAASPVAPEAAASRESSAAGLLPSAPIPLGEVANLTSFRVEVTDFRRGEDAWQRLRAANSSNQRAKQGFEYAVVRLNLTGVQPNSWVGCKHFRVFGAERIAYFHASQFPPEPALEATRLRQGERTEGWCVYRVRAEEQGLILMISEPNAPARSTPRYLALEQGAALGPAAIAEEAASDLAGDSPLAAVPAGREVHTENWSVTAFEILRGDAARKLVENANPGNPLPAEGLEFVAVKLRARYRGRTEHPALISASQFRTIDRDEKPYKLPVVIDVAPRLTRMLFPGGEHSGWAVFQTAPGDGAVLRFRPFSPDRMRRYFTLDASADPDGSRSE